MNRSFLKCLLIFDGSKCNRSHQRSSDKKRSRHNTTYGTTYNPSYNYHSKDFFTKANMRGITTWPWTINNEVVITYFLAGANGITTDTCQILAPFTKFLNAKKLEHKLEPGDNLKIEATRTTYGREEIDASEDVRIIFLEGEELVTVKDGSLHLRNTELLYMPLVYS